MSGSSGDAAATPWWSAAVAAGGATGAALAGRDWSATPLGPLAAWPDGLRGAVTVCLPSRFPMAIWWGPDHILIHNDAYGEILGAGRDDALGLPAVTVWPEVTEALRDKLTAVLSGGGATLSTDEMVLLRRRGLVEECYFASSFSPILEPGGTVGGVLTVVTETTRQVVGARRLAVAGALAGALVDAADEAQVCHRAAAVIAGDTADVSAVEIYLPGPDGYRRIAAAGSPAADGGRWPLAEVWRERRPRVVPPAAARDTARPAVVAPVLPPGAPEPAAVLVVAVGFHREADDDFQAFARLMAAHLGSALAAVRRAQAERDHAEAVQAARADRRFRSLVEASTAVMFSTDGDGAITDAQPSWQAYTGQGWPAHGGSGWTAMLHPDDRAGIVAGWRRAVTSGQRLYEGEGRIWHAATRSYRHFAARATAIRDDAGAVTEWIGSVIDIEDRVAAEAAAARAAAVVEALLAASPVGFGWADTDLRIQHVNPALAAINGLAAAEHVGRRTDEIFADQQGDRMAELMRRALTDGPLTGVEFTLAGGDLAGAEPVDSPRHYVANYFPIRLGADDRVAGVGFTVIDVTERTRLLRALGEERVRYERLAAADVLAVFGGVDDVITEANDAFLQMVGRRREELAAGLLRWTTITPPGWQEVDRAGLRSLYESGRAPAFMKEYLHADGRRVPVLVGVVALDRAPLRWLAYATDLTAERDAQAELRLFRTLVERSGDVIAVSDSTGDIGYLNPAGRRLVGLDGDDLPPGIGLVDLAAPQVRAEWAAELLPTALRDGNHRTETMLAHLGTGAVLDVDQQTFVIPHEGPGGADVRIAVVARDNTERRRSLRRADALARLSAALSAAGTDEEIARAAVAHVGVVFSAAQTRLGLVNPRHAVLDVIVDGGSGAGVRTAELPLDAEDLLAVTAREDRPHTGSGPDGLVSTLTAPLRYTDGGSMGALLVCWEPPIPVAGPPLEAARSVLDTIAGLCGQALQRVRLSEATRQVADLAARLSASVSTAEATHAILSAAPRILGARLPAVALPLGGTGLRLWHQGLPAELAQQYDDLTVDDPRPIAEAFRTGRRIVITDRAEFRARYPHLADTAGEHGLTTTIAVPLLDPRGRPIAAIGMGWSQSRPLRPTDLALLDTITDLCQQTLERTRLAAAEHDLVTRLAGRVTTAPGRHPRFDVAVRYQPAISGLNLGGDWYDVITLPDGRLAVIVGDVVGHQVEAAADMAQLRTVLNTLVRLGAPLTDVFARITELLGRGFLGTALVAVVDPEAGELRIVRAGHPYPVVVPAGGTPGIVHTPGTPPLGMVRRPVPVVTIPFGAGDSLVAFTDGLVERRSRAYDEGVDGLVALVAQVAGRDVDAVADAVLDGTPRTDDDRALVVVRRRS